MTNAITPRAISPVQQDQKLIQRDTIVIIPTGGTVAAKGGARTDTSHYKAGAIDIDDLLLPIRGELEKIANIETQQILSIDSANSRPGHIIMIKNRLEETLSKPDIIGTVSLGGSTVMITQCRCLVHLIELSGRSLIVTGACKPHTAYGSEGLANILASARTLSEYEINGLAILMDEMLCLNVGVTSRIMSLCQGLLRFWVRWWTSAQRSKISHGKSPKDSILKD